MPRILIKLLFQSQAPFDQPSPEAQMVLEKPVAYNTKRSFTNFTNHHKYWLFLLWELRVIADLRLLNTACWPIVTRFLFSATVVILLSAAGSRWHQFNLHRVSATASTHTRKKMWFGHPAIPSLPPLPPPPCSTIYGVYRYASHLIWLPLSKHFQ